MERTGVQPNDVTFIGVLSACNHSGLAIFFVFLGVLHGFSRKSNEDEFPRKSNRGWIFLGIKRVKEERGKRKVGPIRSSRGSFSKGLFYARVRQEGSFSFDARVREVGLQGFLMPEWEKPFWFFRISRDTKKNGNKSSLPRRYKLNLEVI